MTTRTVTTATALAAVAVLAGCTGAPEELRPEAVEAAPPFTAAPVETAVPTPTDDVFTPPVSDDPDWVYVTSPITRTMKLVAAECAPHVEIITHGDGTEHDPYTEYISPYDIGPNTYASGTTTFDAEGKPVAYTVAAGDTYVGIAARFCSDSLPLPEGRGPDSLYAGETIELPTP